MTRRPGKLADVSVLPEFRYSVGESRPVLYDYLATLPRMVKSLDLAPERTRMFRYVCAAKAPGEPVKRRLLPPSPRHLKTLAKRMTSGTTGPLVLLPVVASKGLCEDKSRARHVNVLLYNRNTHEVERIDPKKYHLKGFRMRHFQARLDKRILEVLRAIDPAVRLLPDMNVPLKVVRRLGETDARRVFPPFVLRYLELRSQHPSKTSDQVMTLLKRTATARSLSAAFDAYARFSSRATAALESSKCPIGFILNPETKRCVVPDGKALRRRLVDPPPKPCPAGKVYSSLTRRCVAPKRLMNVNVMFDEAASANVSRTRRFDHLSSMYWAVMNYLMRRHRHARFVFAPPDSPAGNEPNKEYLRFKWEWDDDAGKFELSPPPRYWDAFREGLADPAAKFLVTMVSLVSTYGGRHANVLIYDKTTNEMERFDGMGQDLSEKYGDTKLDAAIQAQLHAQRALFPGPVRYFKPSDYCPKMPVFQSRESNNVANLDRRGNCAVWRAWYIDVRLANPHLDRKRLVALATKKLENVGSLNNFIKSYQKYVTNVIKRMKKERK